jgi:hypothetical protein
VLDCTGRNLSNDPGLGFGSGSGYFSLRGRYSRQPGSKHGPFENIKGQERS